MPRRPKPSPPMKLAALQAGAAALRRRADELARFMDEDGFEGWPKRGHQDQKVLEYQAQAAALDFMAAEFSATIQGDSSPGHSVKVPPTTKARK